jgi:hypothetical protein
MCSADVETLTKVMQHIENQTNVNIYSRKLYQIAAGTLLLVICQQQFAVITVLRGMDTAIHEHGNNTIAFKKLSNTAE